MRSPSGSAPHWWCRRARRAAPHPLPGTQAASQPARGDHGGGGDHKRHHPGNGWGKPGQGHHHGKSCERRANKTYDRLLGCVTLKGVRARQKALQRIANRNDDVNYPGTRAAGTKGYADSVRYVAATLRRAGYHVTLDPFQFEFVFPALLQQLTPVNADVRDRSLHRQRPGDVTGNVIPVDINLTGTGRPPAGARRRTSPASTSPARTTSR